MDKQTFISISPLQISDILIHDRRARGEGIQIFVVTDIIQVNSTAKLESEFVYKLAPVPREGAKQ